MKKITVSKFPKDPGPAAWNAILPQAGDIRRLEQNVTAEWVVIGGGYAGLAAARRLKQLRPEDRIVVLEALRVGEGPAGRNSGFMIDLPHDISSDSYAGKAEQDKMQTAMNRAAIGFAAETAAEYGIGPEAYDPIGKINAAATEKGDLHNREYAEHLASMDEPHELLDAEQMRAATGIDYYTGGLFTPGTVMLQPARFIRAVGEGLVRQGVDLFEHSAVVELNRVQQDWQVRTQHGSVTAPNIILAVNGHAQSFGFYKQRLMHVFTYASMTKAHRHNPTVFGVTPADPMGTTVRRFLTDDGERIVIRNRFTYDPSMEVSDHRIAAVGRDHDKAFAARFPELKGLEMEYRWGGRLCLSRNNVQAFGEVEEGIFSACCQNGLGTSKGTLAGMLAVELATRSNNPMVAEMLKMEAPSKLPPEPLSWIGANATIRWKELKAGREL